VKVAELFRRDIGRRIEEVIKVDLGDEAIVATEFEEYVVTDHIREQLEELVDAYQETALNPSQATTVWVSGFFGSGKSSFAKVLGYLLANPLVEGKPAAERVLQRVGSPRLDALTTTAHTRAPAVAVFLDLATGKNVMAEGESMVLPMYRALLQRLGYSRNVLLAELEFVLEGDGDLDRFAATFQEVTGRAWTERRDVLLAKSEASRVLHLLRPADYPSADSWAKSTDMPEVNHNWFASRSIQLLQRHGAGAKRLVFVVDEVGQYVARNIDRMLDLNGVAEAFQKKQGPLWLVVTSQEKLEDVVDSLESRRIELARARDRFPYRVDLLPSDIYEVASKRVLDKTDEGQRAVRGLFTSHRNKLAANVRLESAGRDSELSEEEFVRLYPVVPYQVDLLIDAVSARRAQGSAPATLGGSNRTIIKLAQQLVVDPRAGLGDRDVGTLVTIDRAAQLLESILPTTWRGEIDQVADRHGHASTHTRIMRAVALTSDVKALLLNTANLAAMLHPAMAAESRRTEVHDALDTLVVEDRLRPGDDGYHIQSPEQKDWEKQRRGREPSPGDAIRIRKEVLRQALAGLSVTKGRVFRVEVTVEGEKQLDGDIALHIDEAAPDRREELRSLSREQAARNRLTWAYALSNDTWDAIVELYRSKEMIRLKDTPSKTQADMELLAEERKRLTAAERLVLERLTRNLATGQVIFRGQIDFAPTATSLSALAKRIVEQRVADIYPELQKFAANIDGKAALILLRADDLKGLPESLYDDGGIGLIRLTPDGYELNCESGPLADLLAEIRRRVELGQIVSGSVLEKEMAKPARGASLEVVELLCAAGVRAARLEVMHQAARITAASDARLDKVFGTIPAFRAASFAPAKDAKDVPLEVRTELGGRLHELTGMKPPVDIAGLAGVLRAFFEPDTEICATVAAGLRGAGLPVPDFVTNTQNIVTSLRNLSNPEVILTLRNAWADLIPGRNTARKLAETLDDDLAVYRRAGRQLDAGAVGLPAEDATAVEQLADLVAAGDLVTHRAEIAALTARVETARLAELEDAATEVRTKLESLRRRLRDEFADLDEAKVAEAIRPLDELAPPDDPTALPLEALLGRLGVADARAQQAAHTLQEIAAAGRLAWVQVSAVVRDPIADEDQLRAALNAIREAVETHLADDKQVRLT
jgi:hypothetical protein